MVVRSKHYIQFMIYVFLAVLGVMSVHTPTFDVILTGIYMVGNGECGFLVNRIWGFVGLENPVCAIHNRLIHSFLLAMNGNHEAILFLSGYCSVVVLSPVILVYSIDKFADGVINKGNQWFSPSLLQQFHISNADS